jgi:hypothetical protein
MSKLKVLTLAALLVCALNFAFGRVRSAQAQPEYCGKKCFTLGTPPECSTGGNCIICYPDIFHGNGACIHA